MPSREIGFTQGGGIYFELTDENGDTRRIELEPQDDDTLKITSKGPTGNGKSGTIDPSGGGNTSLGL